MTASNLKKTLLFCFHGTLDVVACSRFYDLFAFFISPEFIVCEVEFVASSIRENRLGRDCIYDSFIPICING